MRPFQNFHIGLVVILLAAAAAQGARAAEVLLESGAVDDYDAPAMPECPDGQESAVGRRAKAVAEEEAVPPAVTPVSVHQAEQEFYDQFGAETEEEWNELKGELGEEPIAAPPKFKPLKASSAGPFTLQRIWLSSMAASINSDAEGTVTVVVASSAMTAKSTSRFEGRDVISYPLEVSAVHDPFFKKRTHTEYPWSSSPATPTAIGIRYLPALFICCA